MHFVLKSRLSKVRAIPIACKCSIKLQSKGHHFKMFAFLLFLSHAFLLLLKQSHWQYTQSFFLQSHRYFGRLTHISFEVLERKNIKHKKYYFPFACYNGSRIMLPLLLLPINQIDSSSKQLCEWNVPNFQLLSFWLRESVWLCTKMITLNSL